MLTGPCSSSGGGELDKSGHTAVYQRRLGQADVLAEENNRTTSQIRQRYDHHWFSSAGGFFVPYQALLSSTRGSF